ncbi:MAG: hypothetical protein OSJ62_01975 [Lachnospiraceae bacterium]|nr:hypothetical protein [Lachnospiraceae bacterium]
MPDKLKELLDRIKEYWNKFEKKQKQMIISVAAVVVLALCLLAWTLTRTTFVQLIKLETVSDAAAVKNLLDENGYTKYKMSDDTLTFSIAEKDLSNATLLLAQNNIPKSGYSYEDLFGNEGMIPATESKRKLQEKVYKESRIAAMLESISYISSASCEIFVPETSYTVLSQNEETTADVMITLTEDLPLGAGESLAKSVAYMLGNETTDHIIILDSNLNVVFAGGTDGDAQSALISSQLSAKEQLEKTLEGKVSELFLSLGITDTIKTTANLSVDFSQSTTTNIRYSLPEDRKTGYIKDYYHQETENQNAAGGVPGTASNDSDDVTTYEYDTSGRTSSSLTEQIGYLIDESIEEIKGASGVVNLENSSISIALRRYRIYDEETLRILGLLEETTYEEYQAHHMDPEVINVSPDLYTMVSNATGIAEDRITIIAYMEPFYARTEEETFEIGDYLQLIVFLLIVLLLAFVVWRSTRKEEVVETEPELSVEDLLSATSEPPLEDIDLQDKSEARRAIEKFVDENPEAVALLLRNWLDSGWD